MIFGGINPWDWLVLVEHELLLFASVFFLIGALDDVLVDAVWLYLKLKGKARRAPVRRADYEGRALRGEAAVFIPAWREAEVIGQTIRHALTVWPQPNIRFYVGCYRNDPATIDAAIAACGGDARLRLVIHDRDGPSTKADCLNRLYRALRTDEARMARRFRMVVFHDAEDMVDPAAIAALDEAIGPIENGAAPENQASKGQAQFVQLPVLPLPAPHSRWLASHYCEEFAEAHAKALVVRDSLGAAIPAAGVGCAVERGALERLARARAAAGGDARQTQAAQHAPFAADSLTEDYELGLAIAELGGKGRFLRLRGDDGALIATRAYFPDRIDDVVRQKTRWVHGIALQGWERIGWARRPVELWMRLRDRRGPLAALVLFCAYVVLALSALLAIGAWVGRAPEIALSATLALILTINLASFAWRALMRFAFTAREYGVAEGARAVLRIPLANVIAIMSGRRALVAYARSLFGVKPVWDKTPHRAHPAMALTAREGLPA